MLKVDIGVLDSCSKSRVRISVILKRLFSFRNANFCKLTQFLDGIDHVVDMCINKGDGWFESRQICHLRKGINEYIQASHLKKKAWVSALLKLNTLSYGGGHSKLQSQVEKTRRNVVIMYPNIYKEKKYTKDAPLRGANIKKKKHSSLLTKIF